MNQFVEINDNPLKMSGRVEHAVSWPVGGSSVRVCLCEG